MAGTSEIIPKGFRKYYIESICHNMEKKNCQHILFTSPQYRGKRPKWIMKNANTQPHLTHSFLKCFSKYECAFNIEKIQLHEKNVLVAQLALYAEQIAVVLLLLKKIRQSNALLGDQKTNIFPNVYPKIIDNTGE